VFFTFFFIEKYLPHTILSQWYSLAANATDFCLHLRNDLYCVKLYSLTDFCHFMTCH